MAANPDVRPILEPVAAVAAPAAVPGPPSPQQMQVLLHRAVAETNEIRDRLLALTDELQAAARRLDQHFGTGVGAHLTAVADVSAVTSQAPLAPPDPLSPAMLAAVEMAVAGFSRAEVHARMTGRFSIADPDAILDEVFGPAPAAG